MSVARKRLRSSIACEHCRVTKRRCDGKFPCDTCLKRALSCSYPVMNSRQEVSISEQSEDSESPTLDVPLAAKANTHLLIERYFEKIHPVWPVVERADLETQPFAPPLLVRSLCLVAAMSVDSDTESTRFCNDISESIRQCFDAFDLMSRPSLSTLQSLLLILSSPEFTQTSLMTASACRMALILGCHRPQYTRPILYWTCIFYARWDAFENFVHPSDEYTLCFDLESVPPPTEPNPNTTVGIFYHILKQYEKQVRLHNMHTTASWRAVRDATCRTLTDTADRVEPGVDWSSGLFPSKVSEPAFKAYRFRQTTWINRLTRE